ncbi:hypothetical protein [Methanobrevibacter sp.]
MVNDTFNPIQYLCLGNASVKPTKKDLSLGNETIRKKCSKKVDLNKKQIILNASFDLKDVYNTSEIGVANDVVLISHDVYTPLNEDILSSTTGTIEIEYTFTIGTGAYKYGWVGASGMSGVYYAPEPNNVTKVYGEDGTGYQRAKTKTELNNMTNPGFYYDERNKNIYIKPTGNSNPDYLNIIIQTE